MKIVILWEGIREYELYDETPLEKAVELIETLYGIWPEASIYLDAGKGAVFVQRNRHHDPHERSQRIC